MSQPIPYNSIPHLLLLSADTLPISFLLLPFVTDLVSGFFCPHLLLLFITSLLVPE
jgi:hypothetical protein